jgi:hypothetical protein
VYNLPILLIVLIVLMVQGCVSLPRYNTELLHEQHENKLLTEQEFMSRVSQSATLIYEGLSSISAAAKLYALDHDGQLPPGNAETVRVLLLDGGYLKAWPVIPPFAFTDPVEIEFYYMNRYDNMDNIGAFDDVIYAQNLKIEVCKEFIRRYSSFGTGDDIYDYEANEDSYPGETIGRYVKVYAISWSKTTSPDYCDIEWVMQYND